MKVSDVMTRTVDFLDPGETVQSAATRMAELDVGAILIGSADAIEGILTDRDIIVRVVVEGRHPAEVLARDVMTPDVVACRAADSVEEAFAAMREGQFRRMPVLDDDGKPIGVVTLSDLAKNVESPEKLTETLREISEPHRNRKAPDSEPEPKGADPKTEAEQPEKDSAASEDEAQPVVAARA
jgi:CBS domain-containing protein